MLCYTSYMQQKNNSSNLVTKDYFKKELRKDLHDTIDRLLHGVRREITFSAEVITEKLELRLTKHTSLILTTIDPLLKELETRRQDREIASDQSIKVSQKLDNHEKELSSSNTSNK